MQTPRKPDGKKARKEWRKANADYRASLHAKRTPLEQIFMLQERGVYTTCREIQKLRRMADAAA